MNDRPVFLCIAYAFPPILRSGTHRTLGFVRHLDALGWRAVVVTVKPDGEPVDAALLDRVPPGTRVIRTEWTDYIDRAKRFLLACGIGGTKSDESQGIGPETPTVGVGSLGSITRDEARGSVSADDGSDAAGATTSLHRSRSLRDWLSRALMTPDTRIGWVRPAVRAALAAVREERPRVIYSTSPYMSAHLIALRVARRTGLPWVADFRDPWRGNPFRDTGYASLDRWDDRLERRVLRRADRIVCCTPTMTDDLVRRRPFVRGKCVTILNGFDREVTGRIVPERLFPPDVFTMLHAGQFYSRRSPSVWLTALRRLMESDPAAADRFRFVQLGSTTYQGRPLTDWAQDAGVESLVHVLDAVPHGRALSLMAGSDALALAAAAGPGGHLQVPNKLFEYLMLKRPILAVCTQDSPIRAILEQAGAVARVCEPDGPQALAEAMRSLLDHVSPSGRESRSEPCPEPRASARAISRCALHPHEDDDRFTLSGDAPTTSAMEVDPQAWSGVDRFDRRHRARELAEIFAELTGDAVRASAEVRSVRRSEIPLSPSRDGAVSSASTAHTSC
ncbi:MAG: hypothetical protein D6788_06535 [Planctomycetota bacterium]|nr:MAG: hypothetical protein D6788_06535 [Planctomycetota bacterium]